MLFISGLFAMAFVICFAITYIMVKSASEGLPHQRNSSGLAGFIVMSGGAGLIAGLLAILCFIISFW